MERIKRRLAGGQGFCVPDELKSRINSIPDNIGQVIEVERRQMFGLILQAHGSECPV